MILVEMKKEINREKREIERLKEKEEGRVEHNHLPFERKKGENSYHGKKEE